MFAICACARHQVIPKECHLHAVKRIFRYLKGHPKLGLWYPKDSPFDLVAYSDSDYGGATQDRKSTSGGCQFLGNRLISWQCKKQTIVATSTTEAEYVAAASSCRQVLPLNKTFRCWEIPVLGYEPASSVRDVSEGEACPTDSGFIADQDRATIAKSSTFPHDTAPRVTSPAAVEGSMQQTINELTALCTSLQRQHSKLLVQFQAQKVEINKFNARVKILEDNQGVIGARSADDAPINRRRIDEEEGITRRVSSDTEEIRMDEGEVAIERTSEDTEKMATVLTSMDAATVLAGGIDVPTVSYSIPTAGPPVVDIHTGSDAIPTASLIVATATVVTPYSRKKGKRSYGGIAKDAEVARIHAEEELQGMINSLDRTNETIAKNKLWWKVKDFKGMKFEEIKAKFAAVWKLVEDFIPMGSKEEDEMLKRKGFNLEQEKEKKQKTSEEVPDKEKSPKEILKEKVKEMMQVVPIEEVLGGISACYQFFVDLLKHLDREDLNQLWVLVKEYLSNIPALNDKEMELWVELKRLFEPDLEYQLWAQTQNYMHAPIEWKLYDLSGVHHVTAKDKEIFLLVEKDYPLRKDLALVMICYKLQVEIFSQMANDLVLKIYKIANSLKQRIVGNKMHKAFPLLVRKFPLPEGTSHCLKKNATARRKMLPLLEVCTAIIVKEKPSVKDDSFL
nr:uncharacterized mitochondrial protein AtMg00810-like [Tanacetum cinerariifolium]